jgi:hypothetical protein
MRALRIVDRLAIAKAPVLEFELALIAGQHDIGGLVQERSDPPVPTFRDAVGVIDLTRLIPSRTSNSQDLQGVGVLQTSGNTMHMPVLSSMRKAWRHPILIDGASIERCPRLPPGQSISVCDRGTDRLGTNPSISPTR